MELSEFQQRCFKVVRSIPASKVSTYGAVAAATGSCARAVGGAMRKNPFAPSSGCPGTRFISAWYGDAGTNEYWSPGWQHSVPALPLISLLVCVGGVVAWGVTARRLCDERVQDCTPAVIT